MSSHLVRGEEAEEARGQLGVRLEELLERAPFDADDRGGLIGGERVTASLREVAKWHTIISDGSAGSMEAKHPKQVDTAAALASGSATRPLLPQPRARALPLLLGCGPARSKPPASLRPSQTGGPFKGHPRLRTCALTRS